MVDMRQHELATWQVKNFGGGEALEMTTGMTEELGELCHFVLKRKQGIREGATGEDLKPRIADAFGDIIIYGIQLMTIEGIDAEQALAETLKEVLGRDWKNNPHGGKPNKAATTRWKDGDGG